MWTNRTRRKFSVKWVRALPPATVRSLSRDAHAHSPPPLIHWRRRRHISFPAKAKHRLSFHRTARPSHIDTFDPNPTLASSTTTPTGKPVVCSNTGRSPSSCSPPFEFKKIRAKRRGDQQPFPHTNDSLTTSASCGPCIRTPPPTLPGFFACR